MLLIVPSTLVITDSLRVDAIPFLISETMASNIGGTATLIGDPPNILVGSAADLSFSAFIVHLTPIVFIVLIVFLLMESAMSARAFRRLPINTAALQGLNPAKAIRDRYLLWKSVGVLVVVFVVFVLHDRLGMKPATAALGGAALLLLLSQLPPKQHKIDPIDTLLAEIDWPTLFFFIGMFIMIGGLDATGVINQLLALLSTITRNNPFVTAMVIMWGAAVLTMVTSAVPFVLAMIPVIHGLAAQGMHPIEPLWWSLALGACLGANGTLIGSAANMVVAGISTRSGRPITFGSFTKRGLPITLVSLVLSSLYVWLRYFLLTGKPGG
jgi:Na+/H+ antiporter NhaD/arsenite permease-like protein